MAIRIIGRPIPLASFRGMKANIILDQLNGVYASAGAACHSDRVEVFRAASS